MTRVVYNKGRDCRSMKQKYYYDSEENEEQVVQIVLFIVCKC